MDANTQQVSELENAWNKQKKNYTRLHTALDVLEAEQGQVIKFSSLAKFLGLPSDIIVCHAETICFSCIDERVQQNTHNTLSIGVPGNFCLEKSHSKLYAQKIVLDCKKAKISKIKLLPHARCGAATLALQEEFKSLGWNINSISDVLINEKSIECAERMATIIIEEAQDIAYDLEVQVEFIDSSEVVPCAFHNAVGSVVNITSSEELDFDKPHLDPNLFNKLVDPMFNISGFGDDNSVIDRIKLSIDIAFGSHGLSKVAFSSSNPYLILLVTDSKTSLERAKTVISPKLKHLIQSKYPKNLVKTYILDMSEN
jgi:carbonic anhydrase